jgi:6-phosphogluconolactonase (cycloisomerase 2 family)
MKFSKLSQLFLVSTIGLTGSTLLTSCAINTIDYVYVGNSAGSSAGSAGQIETYDADSGTGALRPGQPTVPSGGVNPVSMAVTADYANLYVVNAGDSTTAGNVVHFSVAGNGVIAQKDVLSSVTSPLAVAVNTAETYLYVVSASPALLTAYSLSNGAIGSAVASVPLTVPGFTSDTIIPTGVNVLTNNNAVYVAAYDQSAYNPGGTTSSSANPGWVFGYVAGSGGTLTPASNSPYKAGVKPSALVSDPTNRFVYVTDFASNELIGYTIQGGSTLDFLINGPFKTGNEPTAIAIDPRGIYLYVTNGLDSSVSAFEITLSTGTPSAAVSSNGGQTNTTDTTPVAVIVDPSLGRFIYTANQLGDTISGFVNNPNTGALTSSISTPYPTGASPTALAAVPHGNHAIQAVSP